MKQNTDSFSNVHNNLIGQLNNNRELMQFQAYSIMVADLLKNERKYHIYPQVGKYSKIFSLMNKNQ